jgi:hypothetical protein
MNFGGHPQTIPRSSPFGYFTVQMVVGSAKSTAESTLACDPRQVTIVKFSDPQFPLLENRGESTYFLGAYLSAWHRVIT